MDEITDRQEREEFDTSATTASGSVHRHAAIATPTAELRTAAAAVSDPAVAPVARSEDYIELPGDRQLDAEVSVPAVEPVVPASPPPPLDVVDGSADDAGTSHGDGLGASPVSTRIPTVEAYVPPAESSFMRQATPEPAPQDVSQTVEHAPAALDADAHPPMSLSASMPGNDLRRAPEAPSALILPFVPRGGAAREPAAAPSSPSPFARQPIPYFISPADGGPMPAAAVPPPPSGFRRPSDWARQPAMLVAAAVPAAVPEAPTPATSPQIAAMSEVVERWRQGFDARRLVKRIFQILAVLVLCYATLVLTLMVAYRWVDPPMSALMLSQRIGGTSISQKWVPLERISPNLQVAVVLSEDGRFCSHRGVDWGELREAIEQSLDGAGARGGSTISMQTVKNLFLWPSKSYVRKAVEIPLAMGTEMTWSKARMLEIYLNIAEWGPGVFGAEAAARYHFGKSAAALSPREAALLAVSLPNPFDRQAGNPGVGTQRLADNLQARMRRGTNAAACGRMVRSGRAGIAAR